MTGAASLVVIGSLAVGGLVHAEPAVSSTAPVAAASATSPAAGPPSATPAAPVAAPAPALAHFAFGISVGTYDTQHPQVFNVNSISESDLGLVGRYRFLRNFVVEAELGRSTSSEVGYDPASGQPTTTVDARVDKRFGVGAAYELWPERGLVPYAAVGFGIQQASIVDKYDATQDYAELGLGLRLAVTPLVHIIFDIRTGTRRTIKSDYSQAAIAADPTAMIVAPPSSAMKDDSEGYTRARLAAILCF